MEGRPAPRTLTLEDVMKTHTVWTVALAVLVFGAGPHAAQPQPPVAGEQVAMVFAGALPNVPGKKLTAVVVSYGSGAKSTRHRHAGSVFAHVLSGSIRSETSATGPVRVYKAGEGFFEPPGSEHLVSENASAAEPASLLAVFVADDGARLTVPSTP
jgi:quercetin dioxygenase-like cupin family protein